MDKGAHFYKCDFQVHSPRDLNWNGGDAVSDDERKVYADELVSACRAKGLNAIAITDHHDLFFFRYIKEAAENELYDNGNCYDVKSRLVVFPGIELTFTNPASCQAILILDAGISIDCFIRVLNKLSITPNPDTDKSTAEITPISVDNVNGLVDLHVKLDTIDGLKGKYIVLPNLSLGHGGVLRRGFYEHYKKMPCVGGYVDGAAPETDGFFNIINGRDRNYGFKSVAVFQTSDNRRRDHIDLGTASSWVKWAVPTAEALRQACLAKESRISQDTPSLPAIFITSIDVSNSKFMGQIYLDLSQQYNAIIGGRGTGKSTILEYLRWGLCDQISAGVKDEEEIPGYQEKRKKLIEKTLIPFDSTVQISFIKNNIPHVIRRKSSTNEISLKIGLGEFEPCSEENVRNLLPIQAYSQKQLSSVGVSIDELKRLIYSPIRQTLNEFDSKFEKLRADIRSCYELRLRKRLMEAEIDRNELELKSLTEQVEGLRKALKGISEDDKSTISSHKQYEVIEQLIDGWQGELRVAKEALAEVIRQFAGYPTAIPEDTKLPDLEQAVVSDIHKETKTIFNEINNTIGSLSGKLDDKGTALVKLNGLLDRWKAILLQHKQKYEAAKQKATSQEAALGQIQKIEDRLKEIRKTITERKQGVLKTGDPETRFNTLKEEWFSAHKEKADLLQIQCAKLSGLSDNNLKATLGRGKGTAGLEDVLKKMILGSNIRKEKIEDLSKRIRESLDPVQEWHKILLEFELLANFDPNKNHSAVLPITPILSSIGFSVNDLRKIAEKINSENWIDLFLAQLDDLPLFEYRTRESEYIEFTDASAGQHFDACIIESGRSPSDHRSTGRRFR